MTSWSKLLRREFLAKLDVGFGPGIHEDVIVTCAALLAAESIGAVARLCYRYRRIAPAGHGHRLHRHLAIFDSWEQVFERLDPAAGSAAVRAAVFERAIWHYTTVFQARAPGRGVVPRRGRGGSSPGCTPTSRPAARPGTAPAGGARPEVPAGGRRPLPRPTRCCPG